MVAIGKNLQIRRPISTHAAKFGILTLNRNEKTRVRIIMKARGFKSDQWKPRTEFLYLTLNSF